MAIDVLFDRENDKYKFNVFLRGHGDSEDTGIRGKGIDLIKANLSEIIDKYKLVQNDGTGRFDSILYPKDEIIEKLDNLFAEIE